MFSDPRAGKSTAMRVILSRKGFDSASGGHPSPIIDGVPRSLPIPTRRRTRFRFSDLPFDLGTVVSDLSGITRRSADYCHLDPDLDASVTRRLPGWRGAFGQCGAAQGHLRNQGVSEGDLFLFFGLFRHARRSSERWAFVGPNEHRFFGWLQIDAVVHAGERPQEALDKYPWLKDHPHTEGSWPKSNTIYVARKELSIRGLDKRIPGWGLFRSGLRLTAKTSQLASIWSVPEWLNPKVGGTGCTYCPAKNFSANGELRSPGRGQELVADISKRSDAVRWLRELFENEV
jgi:hypothetical protein